MSDALHGKYAAILRDVHDLLSVKQAVNADIRTITVSIKLWPSGTTKLTLSYPAAAKNQESLS